MPNAKLGAVIGSHDARIGHDSDDTNRPSLALDCLTDSTDVLTSFRSESLFLETHGFCTNDNHTVWRHTRDRYVVPGSAIASNPCRSGLFGFYPETRSHGIPRTAQL